MTKEQLLVTVDTNQLDVGRIERLRRAIRIPFELAWVSVTGRERGELMLAGDLVSVAEMMVPGGSRLGGAVWSGPIPELLVLGESPLGGAVLAGDDHVDLLEKALRVISAGSVTPQASLDSLSPGQRRQLRDALIFEAHARACRHVLVTSDAKGFINGGRRRTLEALGRTRIVTPNELELMPLAEQRRMAE